MLFFEGDNIRGLFQNIEKIIGFSVERFVVESQRRNAYDYLSTFIPDYKKRLLKIVGLRPFIRNLTSFGRLVGLGDMSLASASYKGGEGDFVSVRISDPWFLPSICGVIAGGLEAANGNESSVSYDEIKEGEYLVTAFLSQHPVELEERLLLKTYPMKSGAIEIDRCRRCGGPSELSDYKWDFDRGVIENKANKRRFVLFVPSVFDAIFEELEKELGEHVSEVIIEAEKEFVKTGFYSIKEITREGNLQDEFAFRGLGNLVEMDLGESSLNMRVENPSVPMILTGFSQGIFELISGTDSEVEWERSEDGDLTIRVSPL
jgi:hypothetical protein